MKYITGDIVISFAEHVVYVYSGKARSIWDVIATEAEANAFREHFPEKKSVSFAEFKKVFPEFDGKNKNNRVYGSVQLSETLYLMLRGLQKSEAFKGSTKPFSFVDVIYTLCRKQLDNILQIRSERNKQQNAAIVDSIQELLNELKKNI